MRYLEPKISKIFGGACPPDPPTGLGLRPRVTVSRSHCPPNHREYPSGYAPGTCVCLCVHTHACVCVCVCVCKCMIDVNACDRCTLLHAHVCVCVCVRARKCFISNEIYPGNGVCLLVNQSECNAFKMILLNDTILKHSLYSQTH